MTLKTWVVGTMNRLWTRGDLPPRSASAGAAAGAAMAQWREPMLRPLREAPAIPPNALHLGPYGPLIGAMREALEHFVASHLRLHLAIAEHDCYLLTSIDVDCRGSDEADLLQRFSGEFTPEQIKHYLAKEVIARLPAASAIDLSQFAGLNADRDDGAAPEGDDGYAELLKELREAEPAIGQRPYDVNLVGRWTEVAARAPPVAGARRPLDVPRTPLAEQPFAFDIEDAAGSRRVALPMAAGGHRYVIGKDDGCDVVVTGRYASRRHCELWQEHGAWWVADAGSANGIRVEPPAGDGSRRTRSAASTAHERAVIEVVADAVIVLSAVAQGEAAQYPRLCLRVHGGQSARDASTAVQASPSTPVTPIVPPRRRDSGLTLTARMASGTRTIEIPAESLPFRVGRSRSQGLVVDWAHEGVSGHHVDITEPDESGAHVVVHGDNGVTVAGAAHATGAHFRWNVGETMVLGRALRQEPECTLTLSRGP